MNGKFREFLDSRPLPLDLGQGYVSSLTDQVSLYDDQRAADVRFDRLSLDVDDLTVLDLAVLRSKHRIFDTRQLQPTSDQIRRRLDRMLLRRPDLEARAVIADHLHIDDLDEIANSLANLAGSEPAAYEALMNGMIGTAIRLVRDAKFLRCNLEREDVDFAIEMMIRLWIAEDLQFVFAACHVRLFRPTRCKMFDDTAHWGAPQASGMVTTLLSGLDALERVAEIYLDGVKKAPVECLLNASRHGDRLPLYAFFGVGIRGVYDVSFSEIARPATFKDSTYVTSLGLDVAAQLQMLIWRKAHGTELEEYVEARVRQALKDARHLRKQILAFLATVPGNTARGNADGEAPLVTAYMAVEQAITWTGVRRDPGHEKRDRDAEEGFHDLPPNHIVTAIKAVRDGHAPAVPHGGSKGAKDGLQQAPEAPYDYRRTVRSLFNVLRNMVLEDPDALPTRARTVVCGNDGKIVRVKSPRHAAIVRGAPYTYAEILDLSPGGPSNALKPLLTCVTGEANKFRSKYGKSSSAAAKATVAEACGELDWRLIN